MLLAAAIGSAATATCLWELEKHDPLHRLTKGAGAARIFSTTAIPPYHIPDQPIEIGVSDLLSSYKEQVYDAAIKTRGKAFYIREAINGQSIAYTTDTAQSLYHKAISRVTTVDSNNQPTLEKDILAILDQTCTGDFGGQPKTLTDKTLTDGTPVIDYDLALSVLRHIVQHENQPDTTSQYRW